MKLIVISALLFLAGCTAIPECRYNSDGTSPNMPCIDRRVSAHSRPEQWAAVTQRVNIVGHSTVAETQAVCNGAKACKIGDTYHTTHGDIAALVRLVN